MFKWFKKLLASKISVTIIYPAQPSIRHTTESYTIVPNEELVRKVRKSNIRFVEDKKIDYDGSERSSYHTEEYRDGRWWYVSGTTSSKKNEAMDLHLLLIKHGSLDSKEIKVVYWEGLDKEETEQWIALNKQ